MQEWEADKGKTPDAKREERAAQNWPETGRPGRGNGQGQVKGARQHESSGEARGGELRGRSRKTQGGIGALREVRWGGGRKRGRRDDGRTPNEEAKPGKLERKAKKGGKSKAETVHRWNQAPWWQ